MPDLKFRDKKFFFSLLGAGGDTPLLVPRLNNPDFLDPKTFKVTSLPGIIQLLEGELGITETVMLKVLDPLLSTITAAPQVAQMYARMSFPGEAPRQQLPTSPDDIATLAKKNFLRNFIPPDNGLKSLEKTTVSSLMESHKPLIELAKFLVEILAIAEDVVCMFLGTSIKLFGKNIGFPSRNPRYWNQGLNYATTLNYVQRSMDQQITAGMREFDKRMGSRHPLNTVRADVATQKETGTDERPALYVGYFNREGVAVEPPEWVKNSNKWFRKEYVDATTQQVSVVEAPFPQLSNVISTGTQQLGDIYQRSVARVAGDRAAMVETVTGYVTNGTDAAQEAGAVMDSFMASIQDIFDGTNTQGNNYIDPEDPTRGINAPAALQEWVGKVNSGQLRHKYYPAPVSTVEELTDGNGDPVAPYVNVPTLPFILDGKTYQIEVPSRYEQLASEVQVVTDELDAEGQPIVVSDYSAPLNPHYEKLETRFSHLPSGVAVPDAIKQFFLPLEWEEVSEYNVINKSTGAVVRTETETIPFKIDLESDYELRLVMVVNQGLSGASVDEAERVLGTINNEGNTIPPVYSESMQGQYSAPDLNQENNLKEGIIYHGVDPRYPAEPYFWLVEALKKDERDIAPLNGEFTPQDLEAAALDSLSPDGPGNGGGKGGKEWYGLLDKFKIIPRILNGLLPAIVRKALPLLIKIMKMVSDPSQIGKLLIEMGLTDAQISKFPKAFPGFDPGKGLLDYRLVESYSVASSTCQVPKPVNVPKSPYYYAGLQYKNPKAKVKSMLEGQAVAEFGRGAFGKPLFSFGVNMDLSDPKVFKFITKKTPRTDFTKPAEVNEQPIFGMILNLLKMPFETVFMMFKWFIDWFKRLLNPAQIAKAVADLLTFKWLRDILGKKNLFAILGIKDPMDDAEFEQTMQAFAESLTSEAGKKNLDAILQSLREQEAGFSFSNFVEVFVYNYYRDGKFVKSETEERTWSAGSFAQDRYNAFGEKFMTGSPGEDGTGSGDAASTGTAGEDAVEKKFAADRYAKKCGLRRFNLNMIFPNPFWSDMPQYNSCELPQVSIKPLEMVSAILNIIQEFLNALISMPAAILGLEPTIQLPRFGKEIPFADIFDRYLSKIKAKLNESSSSASGAF